MATHYIDQTATGANDGSTAADAYQSIQKFLDNVSMTAGDTVEIVAGSGPYESISHTTAGEVETEMTDVSFDATSSEIRSTSTDFTVALSGLSTGMIIRVFGSDNNDRQFTIDGSITANVIPISATNIVTDEAAGNEITIVHVEHSTQCSGFQLNINATAGARNTLNGNFNKICAGYIVGPNDSRFLWNESSTAGEWYLTMADGSNPSLMFDDVNYCIVVDGWFCHESAGDTTHQLGTVGSLVTDKQSGVGDNDTLGYNTVYVKSAVDPTAYEVVIPQARYVQNSPDRYWNFKQMFYYGGQEACVNLPSAQDPVFDRCIAAYADQAGWIESILATYSIEYRSCLTWWAGHRGIDRLGSSRGTTSIYNHLDVKAHLGFRIIDAGAATDIGTINMYNCITYKNESSAIGFEAYSGFVTFNEGANYWYPDMTYTGLLAYLTGNNDGWPTTAANDYPASTDTNTDPGTLVDPMLDIDLYDINDFVDKLTDRTKTIFLSGSPLEDMGYKWWSGANPEGMDGEPLADIDTSAGPMQSQNGILHPSNI